MVNKLLNIDLSEEVWKIIDNEFKLNRESDSEVLCNIIRTILQSMDYIQMYIVDSWSWNKRLSGIFMLL